MREKNVSLKAIASKLNVSINTVSHALRDLDDISNSLKVKIRKTAIEMGYMPNHVAQKMKRDEIPVVGIFVDNFSNLYYNTFNDEFIKVVREEKEYNLVFLFAEKFNVELIKQCVLQRVDIIVLNNACDEATAEYAKLNNVPICFAGSKFPRLAAGVDIVDIDNLAGCQLAARYLYNFHNGTKYVFIGTEYSYCHYRYDVFVGELKKLNASIEVDYFDISVRESRELYEMIENGYRSLFFFNDMMAYKVLDEINEFVVDVRRMYPDLHLIGFDGLAEWIPGLREITTIKIDFREFAKNVYKQVKTRLENPDVPPLNMAFPVSLHQRRK